MAGRTAPAAAPATDERGQPTFEAQEAAARLARELGAVAEPLRLRILNALAAGELCVCDLVELLGVPQPTVSRHLNTLRRHRLVRPRRAGRFVHYRLAEEREGTAAHVMAAVGALAEGDPALRAEREVAAALAAARAAVPCAE